MKLDIPFPFTPDGSHVTDAHLLMDLVQFLLRYREQIEAMHYGHLEPLTSLRVVQGVKFLAEIIGEALKEAERESASLLSPQLSAWLAALPEIIDSDYPAH